MSSPDDGNRGLKLEDFRPYLKMLADANLDRRRRQRFDASDLVQQTLLEAHQNIEQFRGENAAEMAAWLKRMLKHNLIDEVRSQRRKRRDVRREVAAEDFISDSFRRVDAWLAGVQSTPSQRVVRTERSVQLAQAVARLPATQREAVVAHYLRGESLREVAEQMTRTEAAVAGLLHRGLRALRRAYS